MDLKDRRTGCQVCQREKESREQGIFWLSEESGRGACHQPIVSTKAMPGTHQIPVTLSCPVPWHAGTVSCLPSPWRIACWNWRLDHLLWGRAGVNWCLGPHTSPYVEKTLQGASSWAGGVRGGSQPYPRGARGILSKFSPQCMPNVWPFQITLP